MTDCDKARETITPLELPMRNFASALASHLNHYFASITARTLRSTFSTQSVDCGPSFTVRKPAAVGGGCVKRLKSQQVGEFFPLLPSFRSRPQRYSSLDCRNREGFSTRRLNARVFTQPRCGFR